MSERALIYVTYGEDSPAVIFEDKLLHRIRSLGGRGRLSPAGARSTIWTRR